MTDRFLPKKRFSQNFLVDPNIARKIAGSVDIHDGDIVMEVGCGQGALTQWLLEYPCELHGVEVDKALIRILKEKFGNRPAFTLHEADILELDPSTIGLGGRPFTFIGNLPYHISSPILFRLMEWKALINRAVFMVQKEVARRIVSGPGSKEYGILSVFCQYHAACSILFDVPPTAFFPRPKVTSSIVEMRLREHPQAPRDYSLFRTVVRQAFNQRRKMLRNSLASQMENLSIDFDLEQRPERLSVDDFIALSNLLTPTN